MRNVSSSVHEEGFVGCAFCFEGERDGDEHGRDGGGASLKWVAARQSVGTLACGVHEGWHGALGVRGFERQSKKKKQTNR